MAGRRSCVDDRSQSTLLAALAKVARWEQALLISPSNDVAVAAAISACEKGWQWRPAVELLDFLQGGLGTAHNSALSACEKARQWRVALVLLSQHPQPSRVSFNAVLSAVERWDQALEILRTMTLQRITADLVTYTAIVSSCATASHLSTSLEMLEKMKQDSVQPRSLAYNAVLHA
eukprot:g12751.t1